MKRETPRAHRGGAVRGLSGSIRMIGFGKLLAGLVLIALVAWLWPLGLGTWLQRHSDGLQWMLPVVFAVGSLLTVVERHITTIPRMICAWLAAVLMFLLVEWSAKLPLFSTLIGALLLFALSSPFVLLCVGMVEVVAGKPFRDVSAAWNRLSEWKQGVLSFLVLCAGIGMVGLILYAFVRVVSG